MVTTSWICQTIKPISINMLLHIVYNLYSGDYWMVCLDIQYVLLRLLYVKPCLTVRVTIQDRLYQVLESFFSSRIKLIGTFQLFFQFKINHLSLNWFTFDRHLSVRQIWRTMEPLNAKLVITWHFCFTRSSGSNWISYPIVFWSWIKWVLWNSKW